MSLHWIVEDGWSGDTKSENEESPSLNRPMVVFVTPAPSRPHRAPVPARVLAVSNLRHILRATLSAIPGARSRRNVDRYVADSAGATSAAVHTGNVRVAAGRGRMYAARTRAEAFHDSR